MSGDDNAGVWALLGRSVPGVSHLRRGVPGQDAWAAAPLPGGGLVVAVADGAGTAERSDEGASAAVAAAVGHVSTAAAAGFGADADLGPLMHGAVAAAREAVLATARGASGDPADGGRAFACTLAVALATEGALWTALRGDCAVVARGADGTLATVGIPRSGEYVNQTYFLTDPWEEPFADVAVHPPGTAVAVLSDGLLPVSIRLADWVPHPAFFDPLFAFAVRAGEGDGGRLGTFLAAERINARTDDDKTIVLAVRRPTSPTAP